MIGREYVSMIPIKLTNIEASNELVIEGIKNKTPENSEVLSRFF